VSMNGPPLVEVRGTVIPSISLYLTWVLLRLHETETMAVSELADFLRTQDCWLAPVIFRMAAEGPSRAATPSDTRP